MQTDARVGCNYAGVFTVYTLRYEAYATELKLETSPWHLIAEITTHRVLEYMF
jgi:hypothetical protein